MFKFYFHNNKKRQWLIHNSSTTVVPKMWILHILMNSTCFNDLLPSVAAPHHNSEYGGVNSSPSFLYNFLGATWTMTCLNLFFFLLEFEMYNKTSLWSCQNFYEDYRPPFQHKIWSLNYSIKNLLREPIIKLHLKTRPDPRPSPQGTQYSNASWLLSIHLRPPLDLKRTII